MKKVEQKTHTSTKSNKAKTICGIIALSSALGVLFWLLPSSLFWTWEALGALGVAYGCIGEWRLLIKGPIESKDPSELHRRHVLEIRYVSAVAIGVTMEFFALAHTVPEARRLERDNLVLRSNVAGLEKELLDTRVELEESENPMYLGQQSMFGEPEAIARTLRHIPKTHVILVNAPDAKALYTAYALEQALKMSGLEFERREMATSCRGIYIGIKGWFAYSLPSTNNWPKHDENPCVEGGLRLLKTMLENGVPAQIGEPAFGIAPETNTMSIVIGQRPDRISTKTIILYGKEQLLMVEEFETTHNNPINQTNLMRIYEERRLLEKEMEGVREELKQRNLRKKRVR